MKNQSQTFPAASHSVDLSHNLQKEQPQLTEATGMHINYQNIFFIVVFALSAAAAIVLACDHIAEYGWAAFSLSIAIYSVIAFLNNVGKMED